MCDTCGCNRPGTTRIDGRPAGDVPSPLLEEEAPHGYYHVHADGTAHTHPPILGHGPMHQATHPEHEHAHRHENGTIHRHPHDHEHEHVQEHDQEQEHGHGHTSGAGEMAKTIAMHQPILEANDRQAERNRGYFRAHGLLVLNVVSSPGSGKTTLIEKTAQALAGRLRIGVVVGDLETDLDAGRLRAAGARAVQVTTGTLCHLEASMVARAVTQLDVRALDILIIENVGNLVCPAAFDLGEDLRVVLLAVTEGEDKPLKYPPIFAGAQVVVVSKVDLAEACGFDREAALGNVRRAAPAGRVFELSARRGDGMGAWVEFLAAQVKRIRAADNPLREGTEGAVGSAGSFGS